MIVYNVQRRWFDMKNDAEAYRKELKLPADATFKLEISTREELAALLNGLCVGEMPEPTRVQDLDIPAAVIARNQVIDEPPDFVPKFLVDEWRQRMKGYDK